MSGVGQINNITQHMRTSMILLMLLTLPSCNTNDCPSEVEKIYSLNKEKSFSEFENWNIYLREGKNNVYVFDYILKDKIETRYLVVDEDSIIFKQIFPLRDTIFSSLTTDSLHNHSGKPTISIELYLNFKSLEIDAIFYKQKERLFLLKNNKLTLVRTIEPRNNLSDGVNFINYKKIDPYWFYFKNE